MGTLYTRKLARHLRGALLDSPETFCKERDMLFEAMGYEAGASYLMEGAHEAYDRKKAQIKPTDFSLRDLYAELVTYRNGDPVGYDYIESNFRPGRTDLLEADAVVHSAFSNIVGQIQFTGVLEGFTQPDFIGDQLITSEPTDIQEEEKVPGISMIGDESEQVGEGERYPEVGVGEEWVTSPEKIKHGFICSLTTEAIRGDKTGLLVQRCQGGAQMMGINREKEILDVVLGVSTLYRRNGGAAQATYGDTHTQGDFDNLSNTTLEDWTDLNAIWLLFDAITDPNTGEPVALTQNQLIVPSALVGTASRILSASEIREVTNTNTTTISGSPIQALFRNTLSMLSNRYVRTRGGSDTAWWLGDFKRAFAEKVNWPITTAEQREQSDAAFERDIVARFKTSRKGRAYVKEPRYVVQGNA